MDSKALWRGNIGKHTGGLPLVGKTAIGQGFHGGVIDLPREDGRLRKCLDVPRSGVWKRERLGGGDRRSSDMSKRTVTDRQIEEGSKSPPARQTQGTHTASSLTQVACESSNEAGHQCAQIPSLSSWFQYDKKGGFQDNPETRAIVIQREKAIAPIDRF